MKATLILLSILYFSLTHGDEFDEKVKELFEIPTPLPNFVEETTINRVSTTASTDIVTSQLPESGTSSDEVRTILEGLFTKKPTISTTNEPEVSTPSIDSTNCICVPFYQCKNGRMNTNGEGIFDYRMSSVAPCSNKEEVCCKSPEVTQEPITTTKTIVTSGKIITKKPSGCGYANLNEIEERIVGNKEDVATFAEFPWIVTVLEETPKKGQSYKCGGTLIHSRVVLTAAHCTAGRNKKFKIRAGEFNRQNRDEPLPHQEIEVESIISHPQFYAATHYNNIAVLILKKPVEVTDNVDIICLPQQNYTTIDTRCYVSGWGKDASGKQGKYQTEPKKIDVPVIDRDTCQTQLRTTGLGRHFRLYKSLMCAGGEQGRDACKGDGGSPLMCPIPDQEGRFYQAGIVVYGIGCGTANIPGVYTNVASFRDWIDEQMHDHNLNTVSYQY